MMKRQETRLRELREELRYWQGQVRFESRCLAGSRKKCFEIGKQMQDLQPKPLQWLEPLPMKEFITNATQENLL